MRVKYPYLLHRLSGNEETFRLGAGESLGKTKWTPWLRELYHILGPLRFSITKDEIMHMEKYVEVLFYRENKWELCRVLVDVREKEVRM